MKKMQIHLQNEIDKLQKKIIVLCSLVEDSMRTAVKAVRDKDVKSAEKVIKDDVEIDRQEVEIEEECLKILALYQPLAADLRYVVVCMKVNNDLERIGDLCCNMAERAIALAKYKNKDTSEFELEKMFDKTVNMLKRSLDALMEMDVQLSLKIIKSDDNVDAMNAAIFKKVNELLVSDGANADFYLNITSVSKQLERIADYATNICEDVLYMVSGNIYRHHHGTLNY